MQTWLRQQKKHSAMLASSSHTLKQHSSPLLFIHMTQYHSQCTHQFNTTAAINPIHHQRHHDDINAIYGNMNNQNIEDDDDEKHMSKYAQHKVSGMMMDHDDDVDQAELSSSYYDQNGYYYDMIRDEYANDVDNVVEQSNDETTKNDTNNHDKNENDPHHHHYYDWNDDTFMSEDDLRAVAKRSKRRTSSIDELYEDHQQPMNNSDINNQSKNHQVEKVIHGLRQRHQLKSAMELYMKTTHSSDTVQQQQQRSRNHHHHQQEPQEKLQQQVTFRPSATLIYQLLKALSSESVLHNNNNYRYNTSSSSSRGGSGGGMSEKMNRSWIQKHAKILLHDLFNDSIVNTASIEYEEMAVDESGGGDGDGDDIGLSSSSSSNALLRLRFRSLSQYMTLLNDFHASFALFEQLLQSIDLAPDGDLPSNALERLENRLGVSLSDFHATVDSLMNQAVNAAIESSSNKSSSERLWASAQVAIDRVTTVDSRASFTTQEQTQIVSKTLSLYQFYKDVMKVPHPRAHPSTVVDRVLVSKRMLYSILSSVIKVTNATHSNFIMRVCALDLDRYNMSDQMTMSDLELIVQVCIRLRMPLGSFFALYEKKKRWANETGNPFEPTPQLLEYMVTAYVQSRYPNSMERCIEIVNQMRNTYHMNISQHVFTSILKLMISKDMFAEAYLFFESARQHLTVRNEDISPTLWFQMMRCCTQDKNVEQARIYFNEAMSGRIDASVVVAYTNMITPREAEELLHGLFFNNPSRKYEFMRNTPLLVAQYIEMVFFTKGFDEAFKLAKVLLPKVIDFSKSMGQNVLNIAPIQNTLISICIKSKEYKRARNIYKMMKPEHRTIGTYNRMIVVCSRLGDLQTGINLLKEMITFKLKIDVNFLHNYLAMFETAGDGRTGRAQWQYLYEQVPWIRNMFKLSGELRNESWVHDSDNANLPLIEKKVRGLVNLSLFPSSIHPDIEI